MKYKIGDILKNKNCGVESMITQIDKGDNTYCLSDLWEPEHYLDENYELLTPHEDVNENAKTVHIDDKDVNDYKPWRANILERYFYISDGGYINTDAEGGNNFDDYRYNSGNYFKAEDVCEKSKEFQLAKQTLKNDAKGFVPDWKSSDNKYFVYQLENGYFGVDITRATHCVTLYFETRKDAYASIENHGKEWRIVFDWENGKR